MSEKIIVLVTCRSRSEARKIGREAVNRRLAACANIISAPVESVYRWRGKVESQNEFLLLIKTVRLRFEDLRRAVQEIHSYDLPEIIAIPVKAGSKDYLGWIEDSIDRARS